MDWIVWWMFSKPDFITTQIIHIRSTISAMYLLHQFMVHPQQREILHFMATQQHSKSVLENIICHPQVSLIGTIFNASLKRTASDTSESGGSGDSSTKPSHPSHPLARWMESHWALEREKDVLEWASGVPTASGMCVQGSTRSTISK